MATPTRNTATPSDEAILETMAADHVSHMSLRVRENASQSDPKDRRELVETPPPPKSFEEQTDTGVGAFAGNSHSEKTTPTPIIVDLPIHVASVDVNDDANADGAEEAVYHPTDEPEKTLAEEILSEQMADEEIVEIPATFESESAPHEEFSPKSPLPIEETFEEKDEIPEPPSPDEEPVEAIAQQAASPVRVPVRPRPAIRAIRPPAHPSRIRSVCIQGMIVLLALSAVAMVAYLMGLL